MAPLVNVDRVNECNFHAGLFDITYRVKENIFQNSIPISFLLVVSIDGQQRFAKFFPKELERIIEGVGLAVADLKEKHDIKIKRLLVSSKLNAVARFVPIANSSRGTQENLAVKLVGGLKEIIYAELWYLTKQRNLSYEELPNHPQLILEKYVKTMEAHNVRILNDPCELIHDVEIKHKKKKTVILKVKFEAGAVEEWNESTHEVYRTIELRVDQTLHVLATAILDALGWEKDHLYCFFKPRSKRFPYSTETAYIGGCGVDKMWGLPVIADKVKEARKTKLSSLSLSINDNFMYLFDFGDENYFNIEVIGFGETSPWLSYPRLRDVSRNLKQYPH